MDFGGNQFRREAPPTRSRDTWWSRRSTTTRLLIGGGAVALVAIFGWPYLKAELSRIGNQLRHAYCDAPRTFNPIGRREDDYDQAPRRYRRSRGEDDYAGGPGSLSRGGGRWHYSPAREDR
jgi:hypothetical protein